MNAACNQFSNDPATCRSSRVCVYVNDMIGDGKCVAAFSNTNNARAYNNYESKTMPQGDLFYYYKDGVCYGDCDGWSPKYAQPDPINVANLTNDNKTGVSFAGMLTPAEMYNRKNIPQIPQVPQTSPPLKPVIGTIVPKYSPDSLVEKSLQNINNIVDSGANVVGAVASSVASSVASNTVLTNVCEPQCSTGYVCENNVCVAKGPRYGNRDTCNLLCGQNYQCQLNVLDQPICMPILVL